MKKHQCVLIDLDNNVALWHKRISYIIYQLSDTQLCLSNLNLSLMTSHHERLFKFLNIPRRADYPGVLYFWI